MARNKKKISFRADLDCALHEKMKRLAAKANMKPTEYFRQWLESEAEEGFIDYEAFKILKPRIAAKLEYWMGKRLHNLEARDYPKAIALTEEKCEELYFDIVGAGSVNTLRTNFEKWNRRGVPKQVKALIGDFFPFQIPFDPEDSLKNKLGFFTSSDWYEFEEGEYNVIKEEVVEEFQWKGNTIGELTINSYEAIILNAANMMIVDVDIDYRNDGSPDSVVCTTEEAALFALDLYIAKNPGYGARVYRTKNGLRYIFTTHEVDPSRCWWDMKQLFADPKYTKLCRFQETFRARISPKPWRVPNHFQLEGREFMENRSDFSNIRVCESLKTVGEKTTLPQFEAMIACHDILTGMSNDGAFLA